MSDLEAVVFVVEVVLVTVEDLQFVFVPAQTSVGFGVLAREHHLCVLLLAFRVFQQFREAILRLKMTTTKINQSTPNSHTYTYSNVQQYQAKNIYYGKSFSDQLHCT